MEQFNGTDILRLNIKINFIMNKLYIFFICGLICAATMTALAQSGTTGGLMWSISGGTLTISGNGEMPNYSPGYYPPWGYYQNSFSSVVIGEGVTSIGSEAFSNCTGLTSVNIPYLKSASYHLLLS